MEESINYMSDNELLAILALICILLMIAIKFINGTKVFLIHLVVFGLYSLFMLYGLTFEGKGPRRNKKNNETMFNNI
jgi:fucose permease